jgi:hypothetical protein
MYNRFVYKKVKANKKKLNNNQFPLVFNEFYSIGLVLLTAL